MKKKNTVPKLVKDVTPARKKEELYGINGLEREKYKVTNRKVPAVTIQKNVRGLSTYTGCF